MHALFLADLICSFPAHLFDLWVALHYVAPLLVPRTPSYLPSSADIITVIGLWLPSRPWIAMQNETDRRLLSVASSWNLQPLFIVVRPFSQCWGHFSWFRESPGPTQQCLCLFFFFLGVLKIIWEPDLVSPAHDKANKVKQSELQHASTWNRTLQDKMSFPINARVIMTLPLMLNQKLEDSSFPSGIPKLCVSFQQGPAANFLNKPGKWDASSLRLTTKKTNFFVVFLNKLADRRVSSLLPSQHLALSKEKAVWRRKKKKKKEHEG